MAKNKELIEGVVKILRDNISGWATKSNGTSHVYPEFPSLDLSQSEYPRAMVDVISSTDVDDDVEKTYFVGEVILEVTVFGVDTLTVTEKADQVHQAVIDYHDQVQSSSGNEYLPDHWLHNPFQPSDMLAVETDVGFTRFQRSVDFEFRHYTTKQT